MQEKDKYSKVNINNLIDFIKGEWEDETKKKPIKYVIYVRRSTDDKNQIDKRQERSIEDQIKECVNYAKREKLQFSEDDIIAENKSAKTSGNRPLFLEMIKKIKKGIYTGGIAWQPDRLSRNMKEAGEIIDMLDEKIIKDLRFVGFPFINDVSGKMTLGMMFVMAKAYSDNMGISTIRGQRLLTEDGKYIKKTKAKNGYYVDRDRFLRPDGANFNLIKESFQMRMKGVSLEDIAEYINKNKKVAKENSISKKELPNFRKQSVKKLIADIIYAGILLHGKTMVNLTDKYDFVPIIEPIEYINLNKKGLSSYVNKKIKTIINDRKARLLNGCVICDDCNNPMVSGITKNLYYFRCDTKGCASKGISTRAKEVISYSCDYITNNFNITKKSYNHYIIEAKKDFYKLKQIASMEISNVIKRKSLLEDKQKDIADKLLDKDIDFYLKETYEKEFEQNRIEIEELKFEIDKFESIKKEKLTILKEDEFIETIKNIPKYIRNSNNQEEIDKALRKIFLNFYISNKKVINSTLKHPFDKLFEQKVLVGAEGGTRTHKP